MTYQKLSSDQAKIFRKQNSNYNIYIYNSKQSILFKLGQSHEYNCCNFLYLVNSDENFIKMSQLCKKQNNYNVIFVQPEEIDITSS